MKKRIVEQVSELSVSRQRKWQLRQKEKGLCQNCSKPAAPGSVNCLEHMIDHRVAARRRYDPKRGRTHQYRRTKSYRLAAAVEGDLRHLRPSDVQDLLNSRCDEHRELARRALSERPELRRSLRKSKYHSFKNNYVGIYGHPNGKYKAGNTGSSK